jgi:hypothetical protein
MTDRLQLCDLGWREDRHPELIQTPSAVRSYGGLASLLAATFLLGIALNAWFEPPGSRRPRISAAVAAPGPQAGPEERPSASAGPRRGRAG